MRKTAHLLTGLALLLPALLHAEPSKAPPPTAPDAAPRPSVTGAPPLQESTQRAGLEVTDPLETFIPATPRSEADADRIEAVSLFAAGRVAEQEDRLLEALRKYQRAARFDPSSEVARRQAVVLAMRLERWPEALRYAAKGKLKIDEAGVLWELARHFAQEDKHAQALEYFRAARALQPEKHSTAYAILSLDVGRMAYLTRAYGESAAAFSEVMAALEEPEKFGLDERLYKQLLAGKEGTNDLAKLYLLFAEGFVGAERFDQAVTALEKANRIAPNAAVHAFRLARVEDARHEPAKAWEQLRKYLDAKEHGEGLAPYQLLGKLLGDLGRGGELLPTLETLYAADPENALIILTLAERYRLSREFEKAKLLYRLVRDKGVSPLADRGLSACLRELRRGDALLHLLADVAGRTGHLDSLDDELPAITSDKELMDAVIKAACDKHLADADSLGYGARLGVALVALQADRVEDAGQFFELAMKVNRETAKELYRTWGVGLLVKHRYEESAAVLRRAIDERAAPADDPTLHFYLSTALLLSDKLDQALQMAEHAAGLNPSLPLLAGRVASILYQAKRYDESKAAYQDLLRRFDEPDLEAADHHPAADTTRQEMRKARVALSIIASIQRDMPAAEEYLSQVLDEFPDDIDAANDLGYLWADESKHLKRAQGMIEHAVAAEPENAAFRDSLGWLYFRLGRFDDAVTELKKAAVGEAPDGVMLEHLGDALLAAGQKAAAAESWQKALLAFEKQADLDKIARIKKKLAEEEQP